MIEVCIHLSFLSQSINIILITNCKACCYGDIVLSYVAIPIKFKPYFKDSMRPKACIKPVIARRRLLALKMLKQTVFHLVNLLHGFLRSQTNKLFPLSNFISCYIYVWIHCSLFCKTPIKLLMASPTVSLSARYPSWLLIGLASSHRSHLKLLY